MFCFCPHPEDTGQCLETFSLVEARNAAKHPTMHRKALIPTKKNDLTQNVNSAKTEESWVGYDGLVLVFIKDI